MHDSGPSLAKHIDEILCRERAEEGAGGPLQQQQPQQGQACRRGHLYCGMTCAKLERLRADEPISSDQV